MNVSYFVERIFGTLIYCFTLIVFVFLLNKSNNKRSIKKILLLYVIVLGLMAFFYIPSNEADLTRLLQMGKIWTSENPKVFFSKTIIESSCPLANIFIYFCVLSGIDGLLPMISAILFYSLVFSTVYLVVDSEFGIDGKSISPIILFIMCSSTFISVVSGVRSSLAIALIIFSYFREKYLNKKYVLGLVLCLFACLIHSIAIPLVIIKYLSLLLGKTENKKNSVYKFAVVIFVIVLGIRFGMPYFYTALEKYNEYSSTETYVNNKLYIASILRFIILLLIVFYNKKKLKRFTQFSPHDWFLFIIIILEIFLINNMVMFARFMSFFELLILPNLLKFYSKNKAGYDKFVLNVYHKNIFIYLCFFLLILAYLTGDISAYKVFVL